MANIKKKPNEEYFPVSNRMSAPPAAPPPSGGGFMDTIKMLSEVVGMFRGPAYPPPGYAPNNNGARTAQPHAEGEEGSPLPMDQITGFVAPIFDFFKAQSDFFSDFLVQHQKFLESSVAPVGTDSSEFLALQSKFFEDFLKNQEIILNKLSEVSAPLVSDGELNGEGGEDVPVDFLSDFLNEFSESQKVYNGNILKLISKSQEEVFSSFVKSEASILESFSTSISESQNKYQHSFSDNFFKLQSDILEKFFNNFSEKLNVSLVGIFSSFNNSMSANNAEKSRRDEELLITFSRAVENQVKISDNIGNVVANQSVIQEMIIESLSAIQEVQKSLESSIRSLKSG